MKLKSPLLLLSLLLLLIAVFTALGPAEATLGTNARVVYLHGAWVWAALAAFILAGAVGLAAFVKKLAGQGDRSYHQWSRSLGRTGIFLWITYLPISLWAMQTNWNGLFLAEPRWRVAVIFAISGLLLQLGLSFLPVPWASVWNFIYVATLFGVLKSTEQVMHPPSPMLESTAWRIQVFYGGLVLLLLLAAWQIARGFNSLER
ncbi:MAG: hypothetical protein MUO62_09150 [Anaerolineales bacterium]|nr:hypothetical protein [Anaerolineales bacterium]